MENDTRGDLPRVLWSDGRRRAVLYEPEPFDDSLAIEILEHDAMGDPRWMPIPKHSPQEAMALADALIALTRERS